MQHAILKSIAGAYILGELYLTVTFFTPAKSKNTNPILHKYLTKETLVPLRLTPVNSSKRRYRKSISYHCGQCHTNCGQIYTKDVVHTNNAQSLRDAAAGNVNTRRDGRLAFAADLARCAALLVAICPTLSP